MTEKATIASAILSNGRRRSPVFLCYTDHMLPTNVIHHQQAIIQAAEAANLTYLGRFGSQARGEASGEPDLQTVYEKDSSVLLHLLLI